MLCLNKKCLSVSLRQGTQDVPFKEWVRGKHCSPKKLEPVGLPVRGRRQRVRPVKEIGRTCRPEPRVKVSRPPSRSHVQLAPCA